LDRGGRQTETLGDGGLGAAFDKEGAENFVAAVQSLGGLKEELAAGCIIHGRPPNQGELFSATAPGEDRRSRVASPARQPANRGRTTANGQRKCVQVGPTEKEKEPGERGKAKEFTLLTAAETACFSGNEAR